MIWSGAARCAQGASMVLSRYALPIDVSAWANESDYSDASPTFPTPIQAPRFTRVRLLSGETYREHEDVMSVKEEHHTRCALL